MIKNISLKTVCISLLIANVHFVFGQTIRNKITNTFIIGVYCDPASSKQHFGDNLFQDFCENLFTVKDALAIVSEYEIGGIVFLGKSTYEAQKNAMDQLNSASRIPLLYMQDFECGLGMRLTDAIKYPLAHTLEQESSQTVESYAAKIGLEMVPLGVHINLAPVCDVRCGDNNITRLRAFSSNSDIVAAHATAYLSGLEKSGIAGCAKHFPGHGPTMDDSHCDLPVIRKTIAQLEAHDLIPFVTLIENNVPLIMTAHLLIPDGDPEYPASLSRFWVHDYLRTKLGYKGVIITDALNMKSLDYRKLGEKELLALTAGNDFILCPNKNIEPVVQYIEAELRHNTELQAELEEKLLRISRLKKRFLHD